jgi:AcrR family transcriptional regulator
MSPAPRRISDEAIVASARAILEEAGLDAVTMQAVAARLGVRSPSLYKHVASRGHLIRLVAEDAFADLGSALRAASQGGGGTGGRRVRARGRLVAIASAYRAWAHANPGAYGLLFAALSDGERPAPEVGGAAADALLDVLRGTVPAGEELSAARTVAAYGHGFVSMELAGAFRLGGDVDVAFDYGVTAVVTAVIGRPAGGA